MENEFKDDPVVQSKLKQLTDSLSAKETEPVVSFSEGQSGADVDWDGYNLTEEQVRVYRRATYTSGHWVLPYANYMAVSKPVSQFAPEIEDLINSGIGWKVLTIHPHGSGMITAVLTCVTHHALATPLKISDVADASIAEVDETKLGEWVSTQKTEG